MSYIEKEKLIKADIASIENRVRHAFNQGYDLGYKEGKANCSNNSTGSNTNNDLAQERYQDLIEYFGGEDVVLNDRKMFMAWLDRVRWYVKRVDELARELEQLKGTTKNYLGVTSELEKNSKKLEKNFGESDCISRQAVLDLIADYDLSMGQVVRGIHALPSVTPQELIHGKCNQCKYYEGVHNVQGHAPCSYHEIGGVMWNWYCSQFESEDKE